jgi:organic hydroperoxide reductase OsmC/OhrA
MFWTNPRCGTQVDGRGPATGFDSAGSARRGCSDAPAAGTGLGAGRIHAPGLSKEETEKLMAAAHDICPYSDLIRNKHDVKLTAV